MPRPTHNKNYGGKLIRVSLYRSVIRPLAFAFDPEWVHEIALSVISKGWLKSREVIEPTLRQDLFGTTFLNPIGLAAGFDKNGVAVNQWHKFGFGFAELGTVTALAQPGNPRPRLFRLPIYQGIINQMGFNNHGAEAMAQRLRTAKPKLPIGVNIGKSKVTPLENAAADYATSMTALKGRADYVVINVSSPNTPGLRQLQDAESLKAIIEAVRAVDSSVPLLVKVAPDLEWEALDEVAELALSSQLQGIVATNTTISREMLKRDPNLPGGLSGLPLQEKSDAVLAHLRKQVQNRLVLIGVGGILSPADAYRKIRLGATLVQTYTGWIYEGPNSVPDWNEGLAGMLIRDGFKHISEAIGVDVR